MDIGSLIESLGKYADGATTITMVITAIGVIVSTFGVLVAALWAKRSFKQKENSDAETARPLMSAHLEYSDLHGAALLKVVNVGATTANNVRVVFDEGFTEVAQSNNTIGFCNFAHILQTKYRKPRKSWVPGHSEIDYYAESNPPGTKITYKGHPAVDISPPHESTITIYYEANYTGEPQEFISSYVLDLDITLNESFIVATYQKTLIDSVNGIQKGIPSMVREITNVLKRISAKGPERIDNVSATYPRAISLSQLGKILRRK